MKAEINIDTELTFDKIIIGGESLAEILNLIHLTC